MKILVLDNYDSFTYNLVHLLYELGLEEAVEVFRNDEISLDAVEAYDKILLSPGPGLPSEAGIMPALIRRYAPHKSILGVCLGHQAIGEAFGACLSNLPEVLHGVASPMRPLVADRLFEGLPPSFQAAHYHSWIIDHKDFPHETLEVIAEDGQGRIMAVRHRFYDVRGVQFHPESVLTEYGKQMLQNWLSLNPSPTQAMNENTSKLMA
jgi:anthranilate synthase component 2